MRKKKSAYLKPYIRRAKKSDFNGSRAANMLVAVKLGLYSDRPNVYVLVQRGSKTIVDVATSKNAMKRKVLVVKGNKGFNIWCNDIKNLAQGNTNKVIRSLEKR